MCQFKIVDSDPSVDRIIIFDENELKELLYRKAMKKNKIILLESPCAGVLTIGVGNPYGFVQFMDKNGTPPYLLAVENTSHSDTDSFVEFDSGGTPTPIPIYACLPLDQVINIALYFYINKDLPKYIDWKEI